MGASWSCGPPSTCSPCSCRAWTCSPSPAPSPTSSTACCPPAPPPPAPYLTRSTRRGAGTSPRRPPRCLPWPPPTVWSGPTSPPRRCGSRSRMRLNLTLKHLTQQAVVLQKKMNDLYQGKTKAGLPPIQIQPPSMSSVLDMLNIINGILFVQISQQDIENFKKEYEMRQKDGGVVKKPELEDESKPAEKSLADSNMQAIELS